MCVNSAHLESTTAWHCREICYMWAVYLTRSTLRMFNPPPPPPSPSVCLSYLLTLVPDGMRGIRNILFEKAAAAVLTSCVRNTPSHSELNLISAGVFPERSAHWGHSISSWAHDWETVYCWNTLWRPLAVRLVCFCSTLFKVRCN